MQYCTVYAYISVWHCFFSFPKKSPVRFFCASLLASSPTLSHTHSSEHTFISVRFSTWPARPGVSQKRRGLVMTVADVRKWKMSLLLLHLLDVVAAVGSSSAVLFPAPKIALKISIRGEAIKHFLEMCFSQTNSISSSLIFLSLSLSYLLAGSVDEYCKLSSSLLLAVGLRPP